MNTICMTDGKKQEANMEQYEQKSAEALPGAFNLKGAAEFASVSTPTMLEWVNRQDFPAFRSGRRWVIPRDSFVQWLNDQAARRACFD